MRVAVKMKVQEKDGGLTLLSVAGKSNLTKTVPTEVLFSMLNVSPSPLHDVYGVGHTMCVLMVRTDKIEQRQAPLAPDLGGLPPAVLTQRGPRTNPPMQKKRPVHVLCVRRRRRSHLKDLVSDVRG